jgi:hypothetical protein
MTLPNAQKILHYLDTGVLSIERGQIDQIQPLGRERAWKIRRGSEELQFDAVVCAAGFHHQRYAIDDLGSIWIGDDRFLGGTEVDIANDLSIRFPDRKESIWFVGRGNGRRSFATHGVPAVVPQAHQVARSLAQLGVPAARLQKFTPSDPLKGSLPSLFTSKRGHCLDVIDGSPNSD